MTIRRRDTDPEKALSGKKFKSDLGKMLDKFEKRPYKSKVIPTVEEAAEGVPCSLTIEDWKANHWDEFILDMIDHYDVASTWSKEPKVRRLSKLKVFIKKSVEALWSPDAVAVALVNILEDWGRFKHFPSYQNADTFSPMYIAASWDYYLKRVRDNPAERHYLYADADPKVTELLEKCLDLGKAKPYPNDTERSQVLPKFEESAEDDIDIDESLTDQLYDELGF